MSDEGVGVHVINRLAADHVLPEEVQLLDGGTLGLDLLYYLEGNENLLLVDAVETGKEPGTLIRLEGEEVPAFLSIKISPHQMGIPDMLFAAKLKDIFPRRLVLFGIQPAWLKLGLDLSPTVSEKMDTLVGKVIEQLELWGHSIQKRPAA